MTTRKQVNKLLKLVADRHSDLEVIGGYLVLKPVDHIVKIVFIDRTSSADSFRPQTLSTNLSFGFRTIPYGTGIWLRREVGDLLWRWSNPLISDDFIRVVERVALPQLRAIQTLDDYYRYAESVHLQHFPYFFKLRLLLYIALGRLDDAQKVLNDERASDCLRPLNLHAPGLGDRLRQQGPSISAEDRTLLAEAIHTWEEDTGDALKIRSIWQRTPFPLELT